MDKARKTVLLVDDTPDNLRVLSSVLRDGSDLDRLTGDSRRLAVADLEQLLARLKGQP